MEGWFARQRVHKRVQSSTTQDLDLYSKVIRTAINDTTLVPDSQIPSTSSCIQLIAHFKVVTNKQSCVATILNSTRNCILSDRGAPFRGSTMQQLVAQHTGELQK